MQQLILVSSVPISLFNLIGEMKTFYSIHTICLAPVTSQPLGKAAHFRLFLGDDCFFCLPTR
jgi:hypothetical protein